MCLLGCSDRTPSSLPSILSGAEEGFVDMTFAVTMAQGLKTGEYVVEMASNADGKEVAFRVVLGREWKKGTLGGQITTYKGVVTIQRIDGRSDRFVQFMDKTYATGMNPIGMKDSVVYAGISLEGNPSTPTKGPIKIKVFYESDKDDEYSEAYINLDINNRKAGFNEKDPEYRKALVKCMKK